MSVTYDIDIYSEIVNMTPENYARQIADLEYVLEAMEDSCISVHSSDYDSFKADGIFVDIDNIALDELKALPPQRISLILDATCHGDVPNGDPADIDERLKRIFEDTKAVLIHGAVECRKFTDSYGYDVEEKRRLAVEDTADDVVKRIEDYSSDPDDQTLILSLVREQLAKSRKAVTP